MAGANQQDPSEIERSVKDCLIPEVERLRRALRAAAIAEIASAPVKDGEQSILAHFCRTIVSLQDWERVFLFKGRTVVESWRRTESGEWGRCPLCATGQICAPCADEYGRKELFISSPHGSDLLDFVDRPWMYEAEKAQLRDITVACQFPSYRIPGANVTRGIRDLLERHLWRDQADVWNLLLPKVLLRQREQDAADKLAAVAIVGRNMSHNIGSHISSKLSDPSEIEDLFKPSTQRADGETVESVIRDRNNPPFDGDGRQASQPRRSSTAGRRRVDKTAAADLAGFNAFLRDRMDLVAELATTEPAWTMPLRFGEIIDGLCGQKLVLKWLLGEGAAQVILHQRSGVEPSRDYGVALPHGVLGMQAFYMLVENALRNSSRHGDRNHGRGTVTISVKPPRPEDDVLCVSIEDAGSSGNNIASLRRDLESPFQTAEGALDPSAWGLKEMRISAAFLRMRPPKFARSVQDIAGTVGFPSTTNAPWVSVRTEGEGGSQSLVWELLLLRPRRAAALADSVPLGDPEHARTLDGLKGEGIEIIHPNEIDNLDRLAERVGAFPLLACFGVESIDKLTALARNRPTSRLFLPQRLLLHPGSKDGRDLTPLEPYAQFNQECLGPEWFKQDARVLEGRLWQAWCDQLWQWSKCEASRLVVCDSEEVQATNPQVDWRDEKYLRGDPVGTQQQPRIVYHRHDPGPQRKYVHTLMRYQGGQELQTLVHNLATLTDGLSDALYGRLVEAGLVNIVVLDERLSTWATSHFRARLQLESERVFIKTFRDPDDIHPFEYSPDELHGLKSPGLLFITVHKNILQRFVARKQWEGNSVRDFSLGQGQQAVDQWLSELKQKRDPMPTIITVHSGRGRVGSEYGLPFIEYSNLERFVRDKQNKVHLANLFMSVRESCRA